MRKSKPVALVLACCLAACGGDDAPLDLAGEPGDPASLPLVQREDFSYVGAFRVPNRDGAGNPLGYSGHALGFNPAHDSLFFGGHDWYQQLCEVSIPAEISLSTTATLLQDLADPTDGRRAEVDPGDTNGIKLGGTLVYGSRLIVSAYAYYDADGSQVVSHGACSTDLTDEGDFTGFVALDVVSNARGVAGYMGHVPPEWQPLLGGPVLTGQCCIPIVSATSAGPAVTVFDPDRIGSADPVSGTTLLFHPLAHPLEPETTQNDWYNLATEIRGVAFPPGTRSVLFFGRHGTGPYCYGTGEECSDPVDGSKGTHAYPYVHQVWAYDANDLVRVKQGELQPWEVRPYAFWRFDEMDSNGSATVAGATFDPATGRLFITERFGEEPVVHVYRIRLFQSN